MPRATLIESKQIFDGDEVFADHSLAWLSEPLEFPYFTMERGEMITEYVYKSLVLVSISKYGETAVFPYIMSEGPMWEAGIIFKPAISVDAALDRLGYSVENF